MRESKYIGMTKSNAKGLKFLILNKTKGKDEYLIEFKELHGVKYQTKVCSKNISDGKIKNPYYESVYGVGYFGEPIIKDTDKYKRIYRVWNDMLGRCYGLNDIQYKTYGAIGIKVCDRWLCFANFLEDYYEIDGYDKMIDKELDKDIKNRNGKLYSLENCTLVTKKENSNEATLRNQRYEFEAIDSNGNKYISDNQTEFAKQHNLLQPKITMCLNGQRASHKGYTFKKI